MGVGFCVASFSWHKGNAKASGCGTGNKHGTTLFRFIVSGGMPQGQQSDYSNFMESEDLLIFSVVPPARGKEMPLGRIAFRPSDVVSVGYNNRWDGMREITLRSGMTVMVREYEGRLPVDDLLGIRAD